MHILGLLVFSSQYLWKSSFRQVFVNCITILSYFLASVDLCHLLITFANGLDPGQDGKTLVLIWSQTAWHTDSIPERIFDNFEKKSADNNKSIKNYPACKEIWASAWDFQQCGILTCVDWDEPLQPPLKLRNSKWCSVSSLTFIEYSSD